MIKEKIYLSNRRELAMDFYYPYMANEHECVSCLSCVNSCPVGAISVENEWMVNKHKCKNHQMYIKDVCIRCLEHCKKGVIDLELDRNKNGESTELDFYKSLVPQIEVIITIARTINLEKTARYGKLSQEFFENAAICLIHPKDLTRLGIKEGNLRVTTKSGSVVVRGISNEHETSEGIIVIANGPWANRLITEQDFQKNQLWFKATIETTNDEVSKLEDILKDISGAKS